MKLVWIQNDAARKATFKKRRKGLIKKVSELSTLCDVKACAMVFSPYEVAPEIWPPDSQDVMDVLSRFRSMPVMEQSKKMLNQEGFLRNWIGKLNEQLQKLKGSNRKDELDLLMSQCMVGWRNIGDLSIDDTRDLGDKLDEKLKNIDQNIEYLLCTTKITRSKRMKVAVQVQVPMTIGLTSHGHHRSNVVGPTSQVNGETLGNNLNTWDSALEMLKKQDNADIGNMLMCSPPPQLILPFVDEEPNLHSYIDGGPHLPTLYSGDNNTWWLDNYFHS